MHEQSIALSLVDVITERLIESNVADESVRAVSVEVGVLGAVIPAALKGAFVAATRGTGLARCELRIKPVDVSLWCNACGEERPARAIDDLACADCGGRDVRVVRGRELDLVSIELADE